MIIELKSVEMLIHSFIELANEIIPQAREYLSIHPNPRKYCQYPILKPKIICDDPEMQKLFDDIPYIKYDVPRYELKDYPDDKVLYSAIFDGYNKEAIDIEQNPKFKSLYKKITEDKELKKAFFDKDRQREYVIKNIVRDIVIKYLYDSNDAEESPENDDNLIETIVLQKLWRYVGDELKIDICVPLCLLYFELDSISLSDNIEIIRIPEEIQKSRKEACRYEMQNEDDLASCATHMLVLHGYHLENNEYTSINYTTTNYHVYPLDIIDNILSIIRIVTGYQCGYNQVLTVPIEWFDTICEDLKPVYGAKTPFINPKQLEKSWMNLEIKVVNDKQIEMIQSLYKNLYAAIDSGKNSHLAFALKRLNRCMLRNEVDDMAIDATIGLESMLAGGTKSEITYTLSNRIGIAFTKDNYSDYNAYECRKIMKKIYAYRSKVVHGGSLKEKDKKIDINGEQRGIEIVAVDFLRQTLLFILNNPEYLDASKFDGYIDKIISKDNKEL